METRNEKFDKSRLHILAEWMKVCENRLKKEYPPSKSSDIITKDEIENDSKLDLSKMSNWTLICEEILDTERSHIYYARCYNELKQRGKTEEEIFEMRKFAWMTAGWLNFGLMYWEWEHLDEKNIEDAIDLLYAQSQIDEKTRIEMLDYLKRNE